MMVAMMIPTAAPMSLFYAAVARKAAAQHNPVAPAFVFVSGYIAMWTVLDQHRRPRKHLIMSFAQR
jgi:predicted metal-binding membrane protein